MQLEGHFSGTTKSSSKRKRTQFSTEYSRPRKRYLTRSIVDQLEWTLGCKGSTSIDTGVLIQEFAELAWRESWMGRKQHPGKSPRHQSQIVTLNFALSCVENSSERLEPEQVTAGKAHELSSLIAHDVSEFVSKDQVRPRGSHHWFTTGQRQDM